MLSPELRRIVKENEKYANMLEEYDRTGEFPLDKVRRSFTLRKMTIKKLKRVSKKTGKSMSGLIDKVVDECLKE
jgi:RNA processing factor Prp31